MNTDISFTTNTTHATYLIQSLRVKWFIKAMQRYNKSSLRLVQWQRPQKGVYKFLLSIKSNVLPETPKIYKKQTKGINNLMPDLLRNNDAKKYTALVPNKPPIHQPISLFVKTPSYSGPRNKWKEEVWLPIPSVLSVSLSVSRTPGAM